MNERDDEILECIAMSKKIEELEAKFENALYLPIIDLSDVGTTKQYKKVIEEHNEFIITKYNTQERLEEGIDCILSMWNYLNKQYSKEKIKEAFEYNMQKAEKRYKVIGKLMISEVE